MHRTRFACAAIAALATALLVSCHQTVSTSYHSQSDIRVVETLRLGTRQQSMAASAVLAATVDLVATDNEDVQALCSFPARLHPASQLFLDSYVAGRIATHEFLRIFSLPNSDYISLAQCFVAIAVDGIPMP